MSVAKAKVKRTDSLERYAYLELRDMIIHGELKPGEQLLQEELAARLGVSRTPLRHAIAALERNNFVEITPRGEAFVLAFGPEALASLFEIRAVLEGLTCRLIAPKIEPKHTAYLRSLLESAMSEITGSDWSAYREADIEFHTYLANLCDDNMLMKLLDSVQIMSLSLAQGLLRPPQETLPEHYRILEALERQDPDAAEREMVAHIRNSLRQIRQLAQTP
jgi:DNA-binding GntR family transcriptional regulator